MLIHEITGCALSMSEEELPDWGHRNGEVLCAPVGQRRMDLQTFTLDDFVRERGKEVNLKPPVKDRSGLWTSIKDVWQIQKIAWEANMRLTGSHPYESRPHAWPTLMGGVSYWQNRDKMTQIYLLGNPAIFYSVLLAPIVYVLWLCVWAIRRKRGFVDMDGEKERKFLMAAFLWLGWALHYVPFYFMHRQLFFHHYLPAHYFMILAFGAFMDIFLGVFRSARVRVAAVALLLCAYAWYFHLFASLVYGNVDRSVNDRRWQKKWNYI
ncbi:hypothetical protein SARC_00581 [Sphaeroforma arctica JP610]|uniref:Protein O-mannosyl-transferase C-terminal four TM domain-containing protein n=1 Tax=Sphaeroforma arctica JP610 TaxID=667725 RepID=A0A0L0GE64_9EUKA|nr:hypothetical protein SARC_00581 [Sphaeroforma arctica JP610]KNC87300.1 hypothetical protein SARC_00581 [Sphaeroforma arctica JP610]|eukprot:XP_014161202.1 hypothetical protein SARC_00581 [Sphaeroforma arctica JP610]